MLKSPAAVRGVQLERPDVVRRLPAPCWRHAGHAPATLCLVRPCCAIILISMPHQLLVTRMIVSCMT